MNIFAKLFKGTIKKAVIDELKRNGFRDRLVKTINDKVDLPNLTEEEEAKLFNTVYDVSVDFVLKSIDKI